MDETFRADDFSAVLERRANYVLATENGEVSSAEDMKRYLDVLERFLERADRTRVIFDARADAAPRRGDEGIREARWKYFASPKSRLTHAAVIAETELAQARINMTARARHVTVRAFLDAASAERWLREEEE